jgi:hypothetical protein
MSDIVEPDQPPTGWKSAEGWQHFLAQLVAAGGAIGLITQSEVTLFSGWISKGVAAAAVLVAILWHSAHYTRHQTVRKVEDKDTTGLPLALLLAVLCLGFLAGPVSAQHPLSHKAGIQVGLLNLGCQRGGQQQQPDPEVKLLLNRIADQNTQILALLAAQRQTPAPAAPAPAPIVLLNPAQPQSVPYSPQPLPQGYAPQPLPQGYAPQPLPQQYAPQALPQQYAPQPLPQGFTPQQLIQINPQGQSPAQPTPQPGPQPAPLPQGFIPQPQPQGLTPQSPQGFSPQPLPSPKPMPPAAPTGYQRYAVYRR